MTSVIRPDEALFDFFSVSSHVAFLRWDRCSIRIRALQYYHDLSSSFPFSLLRVLTISLFSA